MTSLIVLMFASNCCYPEVLNYEEGKIKGLTVNIQQMTWKYDDGTLSNYQNNQKEIMVGSARNLGVGIEKARSGVIGVYTKDTLHINNLVYDWGEARR